MEAFVTLTTNDSYALGACVLAYSLRRSGTTRKIAVMITPSVSEEMRKVIYQVFDHVEVVDVLHSGDPANLKLLNRQDLGSTFTKLHCWRLTQYSKAVFMDADTLVLRNIDDIFEREELSAAPDAGWPDCFNSGVFVYRPSLETYTNLVDFAVQHGSFDGADQGLLNRYFSDWATKDISRHLPFLYNCSMWEFYSYLPALREYRSQVRVVHFIGPVKPWHHSLRDDGSVEPIEGTSFRDDFLRQWWGAFTVGVQPLLSSQLSTPVFSPPSAISSSSSFSSHPPSSHPASSTSTTGAFDYMTTPSAPVPLPPKPEVHVARTVVSSRSVPKIHVENPEERESVKYYTTVVPAAVSPSPSPISSPEIAPAGSPPHYYHHHHSSTKMSPVSSPSPPRSSSTPPTLVESMTNSLDGSSEKLKKSVSSSISSAPPKKDPSIDAEARRAAWDRGEIDYSGIDRFENILAKLNESLTPKSPKSIPKLDAKPTHKKKLEKQKTTTSAVTRKSIAKKSEYLVDGNIVSLVDH